MLDTNVIRSGLQSAGGASRLLLCAMNERAFRPLVSASMLFEYEDVLLRPETLAALRARGELRTLTAAEQNAVFDRRANATSPSSMGDILRAAGTTDAILPGDELPEEWLAEAPARDKNALAGA